MANAAIRSNLVVMTICNMSCGFNFDLLNFYVKYLPEVIFINQIARSISMMLGFIFAGLVTEKFGVKTAMSVSFCISLLGGVSILSYNYATGFYETQQTEGP